MKRYWSMVSLSADSADLEEHLFAHAAGGFAAARLLVGEDGVRDVRGGQQADERLGDGLRPGVVAARAAHEEEVVDRFGFDPGGEFVAVLQDGHHRHVDPGVGCPGEAVLLLELPGVAAHAHRFQGLGRRAGEATLVGQVAPQLEDLVQLVERRRAHLDARAAGDAAPDLVLADQVVQAGAGRVGVGVVTQGAAHRLLGRQHQAHRAQRAAGGVGRAGVLAAAAARAGVQVLQVGPGEVGHGARADRLHFLDVGDEGHLPLGPPVAESDVGGGSERVQELGAAHQRDRPDDQDHVQHPVPLVKRLPGVGAGEDRQHLADPPAHEAHLLEAGEPRCRQPRPLEQEPGHDDHHEDHEGVVVVPSVGEA